MAEVSSSIGIHSAPETTVNTTSILDSNGIENPVQAQRYASLESTSINLTAAAAMAEDDKFMWLRLERGQMHSTSAIDDAAIEVLSKPNPSTHMRSSCTNNSIVHYAYLETLVTRTVLVPTCLIRGSAASNHHHVAEPPSSDRAHIDRPSNGTV